MTGSLALEDELERRTGQNQDAKELWDCYSVVKVYLAKELYCWIHDRCPYYTDHGERHVRSVIQAASWLLSDSMDSLTTLDLYFVLTSILWHDVGMVVDRSGHAGHVVRITNDLKPLAFLANQSIQRIIEQIAMAHSGHDGLDIPRLEELCTTQHDTYRVHTRALAAIVRFADEISETRHRISQHVLPTVPVEQRIYWEYANCIAASRPDLSRHRIVVEVEIQQNLAGMRFPCSDFPSRADDNDGIPLIHYVICRLEKMVRERAYCSPEFSKYAYIREIEVRLRMLSGTTELDEYECTAVWSKTGYPTLDIFERFFEQHPKWIPQTT